MAPTANSLPDTSNRDEHSGGNADRRTTEQTRKASLIPLTTALLDAAMHSISFATPGIGAAAAADRCWNRDAAARAIKDFSKARRLLQGAFQLDHSTSIGDLGSLFVWHGDKPVQQLKRHLADAYGAVWSFPSTHGTTILNILALLTACPAGGRVLDQSGRSQISHRRDDSGRASPRLPDSRVRRRARPVPRTDARRCFARR